MGKVEEALIQRIRDEGAIHLSLIDPEEVTARSASRIAKNLVQFGTTAIMVGGSTLASTSQLDRVVKSVKASVNIPVILFPNSVSSISRYADAVWFMSLLNSHNPLFITGFQALGAPIIRRYKLEAIPLGYIIVGESSTAAFIGEAHSIPPDKPEVASLYALAAQYLGMRFVYLEAGSRAKVPVSTRMVEAVKKNVDIPIIVGGGIKKPEDAAALVNSGASIVVTGTICEEDATGELVAAIIERIRQEGKRKLSRINKMHSLQM
ncbi:MAG: geranylgeranylglyceryl/heptaprenylglyceryl phosphate synthase [Candidatus Bathyarchaeia archaeon]